MAACSREARSYVGVHLLGVITNGHQESIVITRTNEGTNEIIRWHLERNRWLRESILFGKPDLVWGLHQQGIGPGCEVTCLTVAETNRTGLHVIHHRNLAWTISTNGIDSKYLTLEGGLIKTYVLSLVGVLKFEEQVCLAIHSQVCLRVVHL